MGTRRIVTILSVLLLSLLALTSVAQAREPQAGDDHGQNRGRDGGNNVGQPAAVALQVRLVAGTAFPAAEGKAKFQSRRNDQQFEVEIEHVVSLSGQTLTISVNGAAVGTATVSTTGRAKLTLISKRGDIIPAVAVGALVEVKTSTGVLVASGTF